MSDILDMIKGFEAKIRCENGYIKRWASPFGEVEKSLAAIKNWERCIDRLDKYYNKVRLKDFDNTLRTYTDHDYKNPVIKTYTLDDVIESIKKMNSEQITEMFKNCNSL